MKKPKLGSGKRFSNLEEKIEKKEGYSKQAAAAVAAKVGREKYGNKKMSTLATKGRK